MTHRSKALGAALLAALAICAVVASASQAATLTAVNGKYPTELTGADTVESTFTAGSRTISCSENSYEGTLSEAVGVETVKPKNGPCKASGGLPATITYNGCDYDYTFAGPLLIKKTLLCPAGKHVTTHIYASAADHAAQKDLCAINVEPQSELSGVTSTNEGSGTGAKVKLSEEVKYAITIEGTVLNCGKGTTGTYTGTTLYSGKFSGSAEGIHIK